MFALESFFVREKTNWLDILEAFALHNSNIMPILSDDNEYIGYYELSDIMSLFNEGIEYIGCGWMRIKNKEFMKQIITIL